MEANEENLQYYPKGSAIEEALANFLIDNGENMHIRLQQRNSEAKVKAMLSFDNELKRKVFIRQVKGNSEIARIYTKGAPEIIVKQCTKTLDGSNQEIELTADDHSKILENGTSNVFSMAAEGLKVLSFAYKDIPLSELE